MLPRVVLIERPTEYTDLLARHGTRQAVGFFLAERGLEPAEVEQRHLAHAETRAGVLAAVPTDWRTAAITRAELDRFLFAPEDLVVVLGQDGLVANVAKYLAGQPVLGLNPDPERVGGLLVRHAPAAAPDLLADLAAGRAALEQRAMAEARLDDGQTLVALNELFLGHAGHQSARYTLTAAGRSERQSSSGVIVTTGTGATGWAASIARERSTPVTLPGPTDPALAFLVREAWPSAATGTTLTEGVLAGRERLELRCELGEGGVAFGDGIEADRLELAWGQRIEVGVAERTLVLVT